MKDHPKRRSSIRENLGILAIAVVGLAIATLMDHTGMPQKWHAAVVGTAVPFGVVIMSLRGRWSKWTFWEALTGCLLIHIFAIWIVFEYLLANVQYLGTLYWSPIAFVEVFVLLVAVKRVEEKLTGKREKYSLS
jgi:hypothetical protein